MTAELQQKFEEDKKRTAKIIAAYRALTFSI